MSLKCYFNRKSFLRRAAGFFLGLGLLVLNQPATAQNYLLRYVNTAGGAVTFTGNTLGLAKQGGANQPGTSDSIGTFITLDTSLQTGTYPPGTTLNWSNNSSAAVLHIPANSTVLYAELIWSGSAQIASDVSAAGDVRAYVNTPVKFILPDGSTNSIAPDPATASFVTNGSSAIFYVRSADVTALVQAAGAGTYSAGGVPGTVLATEDSNNALGWTLAVVYENSSLHQRNLSLFVGDSFAIASGAPPNPAAVIGFCSPPSGVVNARLFVSALEGDPNKTGDQMLFGPTTNTLAVLSGPNNLANNFFAGQINGDSGLLDTSGTFGLSNSVPGNVAFSARQGWDITSVDVSSGLTNGISSAYAQNVTAGDGYMVNALALQIDVGSPVLATVQSVDKTSTFVGDTLTYTVTVTNSGTADAVNLIFTDPLPFGTSFVAGSFATNGVAIAGANPVSGVPVPIIRQNSSYVITYQVLVDQIPPSAKFITAATINFQYAGACAQSPVINGTLVNADVQTLVPLLNVSKLSSLTNVIPNAPMTYTINIPNTGTTNTSGAALIDQIPAGVTYVTNTTTLNGAGVPDINGTNMPYTVATEIHGPGRAAGVINVGDTAVVTFQVKISATPPARINNSATIFANGIAATSAQSAANNISPVYADLGVGIVGSPNPIAAGAPISYTVSVTNNGPNSINDITNFIKLSLPLASSILAPVYTPGIGSYNPLTGVWSGITLASNGVVTLTISGIVSPDDTASNVISSVTVTPPPGIIDLVTNNNSAVATNSIVQVADLAVTFSDSVINVHPGEALTYIVTAINLGPSTLTSVTVSNSLSAFLNNFTYAPDQGNYNPANGVWSGLALAAGDSVTLTIHATVLNNVAGAFTNSTTVFVPPGVTDPVLTNNHASDADVVLTTPDVAVTGDGPTNVLAGGTIIYSVTVTNFGPLTASNVVVSDSLPPGVMFVSASDGGTTNNSGVVIWPAITALPDGGGFTFGVTVTAPANGVLTNIVSGVSSTVDPIPGNNNGSDPSAITITSVTPVADLAVGKSGAAASFLGGNFSYAISVTNFGPSTATAFSVTDSLPGGIIFVSSLPVATTNGGNQVIWTNLNDLAAGATTNLTVNVAAAARGTIANLASVGSPTLDTFTNNNISAPVITAVTNRPPVAVNDNATTTKNVAVTIPVLANDSDPDGDALTIISLNPTNGTANIVGTNVVFTPTNNFIGAAFCGYTITDSHGGTNSALITINVTNRPPVANNQSVTVAENTSKAVTLTGSDADGDPLTYIIVGTPVNGVLSLVNTNTGAVTYVPNNNYVGPDSFTFRVNDGTTNSSLATVSISVTSSSPANLAVIKTGPTTGGAGSNLVYTITVTNAGPSAATNVLVSDQLPAGFNFVSATPATATVSNNLVSWPKFNLANKGKGSFTVTAVSPAGGIYTNIAFAVSDAFDVNPTNNNGTATNSQTRTVVTAEADVAVFKTGGTNVLANGAVTYTITATNLGPSTATNVIVKDNLPANTVFQSASPAYTLSSGVVTWPSLTLAKGGSTNFSVTLVAPASGAFTNIALSTSGTADPVATNNNGSSAGSKVRTTVTPVADLIVLLSGPANVSVGDNFNYTIIVTNGGPSAASNVVLKNKLPPNLTFISASSGGTFKTNVITWPTIVSLANGATTNFTLTVNAPGVGQFTNIAFATSSTLDLNLTNNDGTASAAQVRTVVASPQFALLIGTNVFNPQTGLFEESVVVTNIGDTTVAGVRLYVSGLRTGVILYNATGTTNGTPYVQYNFPVDPGNTVTFALEFYDTNRLAFTNTLTAVAILPPDTTAGGTNGVAITREFLDTRIAGDTRFVIEFATVPGKTYTIIYSDDLVTWKVATPGVTANANVTQWYDDGPPKTGSKPASVNNRFYRIIQN